MGWADNYIKKLEEQSEISFRPRGNSMTPRIKSGQLCTVAKVDRKDICVGDVVLCRVAGKQYLHIVKARTETQFLIGNNHGKLNGWTSPGHIYGKVIKIED
jgi:hypothetical protein